MAAPRASVPGRAATTTVYRGDPGRPWPPCERCGHESWHVRTHKAAYRQSYYYCCRCNVETGGTPAEHHPECLAVAAERDARDAV